MSSAHLDAGQQVSAVGALREGAVGEGVVALADAAVEDGLAGRDAGGHGRVALVQVLVARV